MNPKRLDEPTLSVEPVKRYVREQASLTRRIVHTLLLLLDVGVVTLLVALWSTEPQLPFRTHLAFGAMLVVGLAWLGFFSWVLWCRRPLFALDRVVASQLALGFTTLFLAGGLTIAVQRGHWPAVLTASLVGGMFVAAAAVALARALRTRRSLLQRRDELEAALILGR